MQMPVAFVYHGKLVKPNTSIAVRDQFYNRIGREKTLVSGVYNDKVDPSLLVVACNEPGCLERFLSGFV